MIDGQWKNHKGLKRGGGNTSHNQALVIYTEKTSSGEKRTATRRSSSLQGKGIGEIKGRLFKRSLT